MRKVTTDGVSWVSPSIRTRCKVVEVIAALICTYGDALTKADE
jgi:hypothetical protein